MTENKKLTVWEKIQLRMESDVALDETFITPYESVPDITKSKLPKLYEYEEAPV